MPDVYIVIDHWFPVARRLSQHHKFFFLTNRPAILDTPSAITAIVDNGTYYYGRPRYDLIRLAIMKGYRFILPDYICRPQETLRAHLNFFEKFEEEVKKLGFLVLQGKTAEEMLELLDKYDEYGLTIVKRIAIGGPANRKGQKKDRVIIIKSLYRYLKRRGFHVHALGLSTYNADSFDTVTPLTWWFRKKYTEENWELFLNYFKKWVEKWNNNRKLTDFFNQ